MKKHQQYTNKPKNIMTSTTNTPKNQLPKPAIGPTVGIKQLHKELSIISINNISPSH
jgi:hypothetical protein